MVVVEREAARKKVRNSEDEAMVAGGLDGRLVFGRGRGWEGM